jgi:hypothetical protein
MFSIVENFDNLPINALDSTMVFVSMENCVYIFENNVWHKYDDYIGFEEVASVTLSEDFVSENENIVFADTPFYDSFKLNNLYCVKFSCDKLSSFNDTDLFNFNIIKNDESIMFSSSALIRVNPNFKIYFYIDQEVSEENPNPVREYGFNVNASNIIITNPITLSVYKSLREV